MEDAMKRYTTPLALAVALAGTACALPTHAVRTTGAPLPPYQGPIEVSMSAEPESGRLIAVVEVDDTYGTVDDMMPAFLRRVATEGGNFAKIDDIGMRYEMRTCHRTETYECGTKDKPKKCERTVTDATEVGTFHILGRAFLVERRTP
jgi:hypothetical protein